MILVTGATGNIGGELVTQLSAAGRSDVGGLVRAGNARLPPGVQPVLGDLNNPETFAPALDGVESLFLLPGYEGAEQLLSLARDAGARRVVQLSGSSADASPSDNVISRYMIAAEDAVHRSGIEWTILRPCAFMSNALQWVSQLRRGDVLELPFADVAKAVIDPYDIARVAKTALLCDGHAGKTYRLSGPESLLPRDQVRVLAETFGRKIQFQAQSNEEARVEMSAEMPAEYVEAFMSFHAEGAIDESKVQPTVMEVTGTGPRTFAEWASDHADAFA